MSMPVKIKIIDERLREWGLPAYAKPGDAGMDVRACVDGPLVIKPNQVEMVPLGFAIDMRSDAGVTRHWVAHLVPRSGLGHKGIVLGNLIGTIDMGYQGQVCASVWNRTSDKVITIKPGRRIAQMIFSPVINVEWEEVFEFSESERGDGGFGHTGER